MSRFWKLSVMMAVIVIIDQLLKGTVQSVLYIGESKVIIANFLKYSYVRNTGLMFGFFSNLVGVWKEIVMIYFPIAFCLLLFSLIILSIRKSLILPLSYSLILSGAFSNLLDRLTLGYVVDYITFYNGASTLPTINIADISISIAIGLLIFDLFHTLLIIPKEVKNATHSTENK
jgi:signal peptidase II